MKLYLDYVAWPQAPSYAAEAIGPAPSPRDNPAPL